MFMEGKYNPDESIVTPFDFVLVVTIEFGTSTSFLAPLPMYDRAELKNTLRWTNRDAQRTWLHKCQPRAYKLCKGVSCYLWFIGQGWKPISSD